MKKVLLVVLITLCLFGCGKEEVKTQKKAELNVIKNYEQGIYLDTSTNEMFTYSYDEENNKYTKIVAGKDGILYDKEVTRETSDDNHETVYKTFSRDGYTIKSDDNKLSVEYNGKVIIDNIDYLKSGFESGTVNNKKGDYSEVSTAMLLFTKNSDNFILRNTSYYWDYDESQVKWDKAKTYLIGKEGIVKTFDGYLATIYYKEGAPKYLYNYKDGKITIYNTNFEKIYSFDVDINDETLMLSHMCFDYANRDYCKIDNKLINITNKKELSEKEAYYIPFDEKYGFTLIKNRLTIYSYDDKIGEFDNIGEYLKGFYFSQASQTSVEDQSANLCEVKVVDVLDK